MTPRPPYRLVPWYLRIGAVVLACAIALYVVAAYVYGVQFVHMVSSLRPPPEQAAPSAGQPTSGQPGAAPQRNDEPGVVTFEIVKPKPPPR